MPILLRLLALALFAAFGASAAAAPYPPLTGQASVIDADTIEIRGKRIRLQGVDAPESRQICLDAAGGKYRCGQKASLALADLIGRGHVTCDISGLVVQSRHLAIPS
jgi:endonuclease YncB( thermonuclease family)